MGLAVVTVAAGGIPVVDVSAVAPLAGVPVTEAANGRGVAVTKVAARGMAVVYVAPPLFMAEVVPDPGPVFSEAAGGG